MTVISRLEVDHPALATAGGSALHTLINAIYLKVGDAIGGRFYTQNALANSSSVDFEHNYKCAFDQLRWTLYIRDTGSGELTRVDAASSPAISSFTIVATPSFLTTKIRVTNSSGSSRDIALVTAHSPIMFDDVHDVDLTTSAPLTGETVAYDSSDKKWKPRGRLSRTLYVNAAGSGPGVYTTLALALAAASDGDRILVTGALTVTADVVVSTKVILEFLPGCALTASNGTNAVLDISASDVHVILPHVVMTKASPIPFVRITGDDVRLDHGFFDLNSAGTLAYAALYSGNRGYLSAGLKKSGAGGMTAEVNDTSSGTDLRYNTNPAPT